MLRMDQMKYNCERIVSKAGYLEAGIVPCEFNGIPGVNLVLLEKNFKKNDNENECF